MTDHIPPPGFDWDPHKALTNLSKHGVSFQEAATVFDDLMAIIFTDPIHAVGEARFIALGRSLVSRLVVVVHCEREHGAIIRIISARTATAREQQRYFGKPT